MTEERKVVLERWVLPSEVAADHEKERVALWHAVFVQWLGTVPNDHPNYLAGAALMADAAYGKIAKVVIYDNADHDTIQPYVDSTGRPVRL
jgi:hypothetical protein